VHVVGLEQEIEAIPPLQCKAEALAMVLK
jgi:hypothetical protein